MDAPLLTNIQVNKLSEKQTNLSVNSNFEPVWKFNCCLIDAVTVTA